MKTHRPDLHWNVLTAEQVAPVVAATWAINPISVSVDARGVAVKPFGGQWLEFSCPCLECLDRAQKRNLPILLSKAARVQLTDRELLSDKLGRLSAREIDDEITLPVPRWPKLTPEQVGACVAYLFRIGSVREVRADHGALRASFNPLWTEAEEIDHSALHEELAALSSSDVVLCPCGCGVPQVLGPCRRDYGDPDVLMRELNLYRTGKRVQAIREIRQRTGCELHEARLRLRVVKP